MPNKLSELGKGIFLLQAHIKRLQARRLRQQQRLDRIRHWRLTAGLGGFLLLIFSQVQKGWGLEWLAFLVFWPSFLVFYRASRQRLNFINSLAALEKFYEHQWMAISGTTPSHTSIDSMADPDLARDLDLTTLFDQLNLCHTSQGAETLNRWLCQVNLDPQQWEERQEQLKLLALHPHSLRRWHTFKPAKPIALDRLQQEFSRPFLQEKPWWIHIIPLSWLTSMALLITGTLGDPLRWTLLIFVGSSLLFLQKTQYLLSRLEGLSLEMQPLAQSLKVLHRLSASLNFVSSLKEDQPQKDLKTIHFWIALLSVRTNPILFYILNTLLPWDYTLALWVERHRHNFLKGFLKWSEELENLDVLMALVTPSFYQPTCWPERSTQDFIVCKGLVHPLLPQTQRVPNDFNNHPHPLILITGSNMSGKSTFLRALGINFCLARIGAPVFAHSFSFADKKIVTCIRVSDSLRDGQSYFYAEVQRIKKIVNLAANTPLLFMIDEPLRGTNNQERLIGNQNILQRLLKNQGRGFICTHDLELTKMAEEFSEVANYHFDDHWEQGQLSFDYKIKPGPSQTTNALKILEREGLLS